MGLIHEGTHIRLWTDSSSAVCALRTRMTRCSITRDIIDTIFRLVEARKCALSCTFHYRARPLAQVPDFLSKLTSPALSPRGLGFVITRFRLTGGSWRFFGKNPADFFNFRLSQALPEWAAHRKPAVVFPLQLSHKVVHTWLRAMMLACVRPTIFLIPPYHNSTWYRELLSGAPILKLSFTRTEWWGTWSTPPMTAVQRYYAFVYSSGEFHPLREE